MMQEDKSANFKNKNILITGASSGIGAAMAHYFYNNGANLILIARNQKKLDGLANMMKERVKYYATDLTCLENIESIFLYCKNQGVKLDGIIHCAGQTANVPLRVNNIEEMEQLLKVNLEAFIQLCKFASSKRYMNDGGAIVAMSSTASFCGNKGLSVYSASKAGINSAIKSAARELISRKIRINGIAPAMVRTPMYYETIREIPDMEKIVKSEQPFGLIEPEYLAELCGFLLSDRAKYITGEIVIVGAGHIY